MQRQSSRVSSVLIPSQVRLDVDDVLGCRWRRYVKNRRDDRREVARGEGSSCEAHVEVDVIEDVDDDGRRVSWKSIVSMCSDDSRLSLR